MQKLTLQVGKVHLNPLVISSIHWNKGIRGVDGVQHYSNLRASYGWGDVHPYKNLLVRKLPWYKRICWSPSSIGSWSSPRVRIYGSDGDQIFSIRCSSNARAEALHAELLQEWQNLLSQFRVPE